MKKTFTFLFSLFTFCAISQPFPDEMQLSADGTRLTLGGQTTTGFYNESKIRIITSQNEVVINEFMASNDATIADQDGEFDDWIELYNNTSSDVEPFFDFGVL